MGTKKALISPFFVFSEAGKVKLKSVHFCAFFVFSETEKTDFAHGLFDPEMLFPEAGKMDSITFWEQLLRIEFYLLQA